MMVAQSLLGALALTLALSAPTYAQGYFELSCKPGEVPEPNGSGGFECRAAPCPEPEMVYLKRDGFYSCYRLGNSEVTLPKSKFGLIRLGEGKETDLICFGVSGGEKHGTRVRDEVIPFFAHAKGSLPWVATISYDADSSFSKIQLIAVTEFLVDKAGHPTGYTPAKALSMDVPLYDHPQIDWPCTGNQWASIVHDATRDTDVVSGSGQGQSSGAGRPMFHPKPGYCFRSDAEPFSYYGPWRPECRN
jgi:hypothetical protein